LSAVRIAQGRIVVAVIEELDLAVTVPKGHTIRPVDVCLPHVISTLNSVSTKPWMTRVFVQSLDALQNAVSLRRRLLFQAFLEAWTEDVGHEPG
jgi:hypothetical protein